MHQKSENESANFRVELEKIKVNMDRTTTLQKKHRKVTEELIEKLVTANDRKNALTKD